MLTANGYLAHQSGKWWEGSFADGGFTHGMTHVLFREATSQTEQARGSETQEEKFFHELQRAAD